MSRRRFELALALAALCAAATASAQTTYDWNNPLGGDYFNTGNWSPNVVPTSTHVARFALANTYTVTFSGNATVLRHIVSQGNVTWNLNGFNFTNTDTVNNGVGNNVTPVSLRVINGNFLPGNFSVGGTAGVVSSAVFDQGLDATIGAGVFFVGTSGTGDLTVQGGSTVTTTGGSAGIGLNTSGIGTVTVIGSGSSLNVAGNYRVAGAGQGTLVIKNGAAGSAGSLTIGESAGGVGVMTVTGAGASFSTNGTTHIGGTSALSPAASATLNVGPGATVGLNGTTHLRTSATVNITGGTLNLGALTVADGATVNWSAGKVNFADGATVTAPVMNLLLAGTNTLGANRTLSATAGTLGIASNLAVNGGSIAAADLSVDAGLSIGAFGTVTAAGSVSLGAGRAVQIENFGTLGAGSFIVNNGATLQLNGPGAAVTGFTANNAGLIQGTGRFFGGLNNGTGGTIRARAGDHLIIDGIGPTNLGNIELSGGTVEYRKTLSNLANGFISGRGEFRGSTDAPGGTGLSNQGVMAFSGGSTDIRGDVLNTGGGRIVVAGGSVVTFYDDVVHNGTEIRIHAGSRAVFFGSQSGSGAFTGSGTVEYADDLRPGNSPAEVSYGGDVVLNPTATLYAELGGTSPGTRFDRITVADVIELGGVLRVEYIDGFTAAPGDSFELITAGRVVGTFDQIAFPDAQDWYAQYTGQALIVGIQAVPIPEPAAAALLALAAVGAVLVRRRRR